MLSLPFTEELTALRAITRKLDAALSATDAALRADLAAKEAAKKEKDPIDVLEEKLMASTAVAAAASGTPEQAREMLAKARAKAWAAAADGAETAALEAMVRQMEHLAKVAEQNRRLKNAVREGTVDASAEVIPALAAAGRR